MKPLKIGIVGAGMIGGTLAELWARAGHEALAALRAGEPCAVGGEAALRLYGLTRCPDQIVIWTPADRRPRSDWSVRMRRDTIGRLDRRRGLLPRIRIDDAVVDVAEQLGIEAAVSLLSEATRQRQTDPRALLRAVEPPRDVGWVANPRLNLDITDLMKRGPTMGRARTRLSLTKRPWSVLTYM